MMFGVSQPKTEDGQLAPLLASVPQTLPTATCTSASLTLDCRSSSGLSLAVCLFIHSLMLLYFVSRACGEERELEKPAKDSALENK